MHINQNSLIKNIIAKNNSLENNGKNLDMKLFLQSQLKNKKVHSTYKATGHISGMNT